MTTCLEFTDASDDGYGGFILKCPNKEVCSSKFQDCEKQMNSPHRELLAVKYVLDSFGEMLQTQSVQVNLENVYMRPKVNSNQCEISLRDKISYRCELISLSAFT